MRRASDVLSARLFVEICAPFSPHPGPLPRGEGESAAAGWRRKVYGEVLTQSRRQIQTKMEEETSHPSPLRYLRKRQLVPRCRSPRPYGGTYAECNCEIFLSL